MFGDACTLKIELWKRKRSHCFWLTKTMIINGENIDSSQLATRSERNAAMFNAVRETQRHLTL